MSGKGDVEHTGEEMKGVKGWLILLCLALTVFDPSAVLVNLFLVTDIARPYFAKQPGLFRLMLINGVAGIALSVFSLYAGISLWKRLPAGPAVARKYMLAVSGYSVLAPLLPGLLHAEQHQTPETIAFNCINSLFTIAYAAVWYLYLKRSRRVRATYGEQVRERTF